MRISMDLSSSRFLFLDCQTTGLSHQRAELLELGWSLSFHEKDIQTRLVRPSEITTVPKKVWRMTGITVADAEGGKAASDIWEELRQAVLEGPVPICAAVIHYSQFELPFLKALHKKVCGEESLPWPVICSYRVSARLHQDLPARTLRALSGHLGFVLPETHRSREHVAATQKIWRHLLEGLRTRESVTTWDDLQSWLAKKSTRPSKREPRKYLIPRELRLDLPETPGVYQMHSSTGSILYIGKATSLRSRVNSYFRQRRSTRAMLGELMTQVASIEVTETETALEAALLENDRIKRFQPQYNSSLRTYDRRIGFVASDLSEVSLKPSAAHPWGPFLSPRPFESLERLLLLQKEQLEEKELLLLAHDPREMKIALEALLRLLGIEDISNLTLKDLLKAGRRLLPSQAVNDAPNEEPDILSSLQRKLKRPIRLLHHAHWLCWMMESRVAWQVSVDNTDRWRFLTLAGGKIVDQGYRTERELSHFKRPRVAFRSRQEQMTVETYDRMRILLTELAILTKRNVRVQVEFSASRVYRTDRAVGLIVHAINATRQKDDEVTINS